MKKRICIYCGAKDGSLPELGVMAQSVGEKLGQSGFDVVYGGANVGLMGQVATGALNSGAKVIGVIPKVIFDFEVSHTGITELITVNSMHERKLKMMELSDAFIALPGGFGTMDELNEIITWRQIKLHNKPIAIYNFNGYYDHYIDFLKVCVAQGLVSQAHLDMLIVSHSLEQILAQL